MSGLIEEGAPGTPWWETTDAQTQTLAKRICARHGNAAEDMALPYPPLVYNTATGPAHAVRVDDLRPLWTFYIHLARAALECRDDQAIDEAVSTLQGTFVDTGTVTPDANWKQEIGLDGHEDQT